MKKSILTAILIVGGISSAFSQTLFVPGGFSTAGVGTSNISGKVGIGTSSPAEKLHVIGNVRFNLSQGNLKFTDSPLAGPGGMAISANDNMLSLPQPLALVASKFYFSGGNVGIGTNNPSYSLSINKNSHTFSVNPHSNGIDLHSTGNYSPHYQTSFNIYKGNIGSGQLKFTVDQNGNVGIGTSTPTEKLEVNGHIKASSITFGTPTQTWTGGWKEAIKTEMGSCWMTTDYSQGTGGTGQYMGIGMTNTGWYFIASSTPPGANDQIDPPKYAFHVETSGKVIAREILVSLTADGGWPDYVFNEKYNLPTLKEVENYIDENKHLPGVPSESEVKEGGINLGNMDAILLQKIEELTLYMIALKKENEEQSKMIETLSNE